MFFKEGKNVKTVRYEFQSKQQFETIIFLRRQKERDAEIEDEEQIQVTAFL